MKEHSSPDYEWIDDFLQFDFSLLINKFSIVFAKANSVLFESTTNECHLIKCTQRCMQSLMKRHSLTAMRKQASLLRCPFFW